MACCPSSIAGDLLDSHLRTCNVDGYKCNPATGVNNVYGAKRRRRTAPADRSKAGAAGLGSYKLRRVVAVSRAALLPSAARYQGALQANLVGRRLGNPAAGANDACFQHFLWKSRGCPFRRRALSCFCVHGTAPMAIVRLRFDPFQQ